MKRTIITSTLLAFAAAGFAQQSPERTAPTPEQVAQREANSLSERLKLTEDQRSKAYSVYLDRAKDQKKEREARMKEMKKMRERGVEQAKAQDEKINKFLNEDQKKSYQQFRDQNRGGGFRGPQMNRPGQIGDRAFRQDFRRQQLQRPGRPDSRFQRGPDPRFQQRGGGFRVRPDLRNQFRGPGTPGARPQLNRRPQGQNFRNRPDRLQSRPERIENRRDSVQHFEKRSPQQAPDNIQPVPAEKK